MNDLGFEALGAVSLGLAVAGAVALLMQLVIMFRKGRFAPTRDLHGAMELVAAATAPLGCLLALGVAVAAFGVPTFDAVWWIFTLYALVIPFVVVFGMTLLGTRRHEGSDRRLPIGGDWIPVMTARRWAGVTTAAIMVGVLVWGLTRVSGSQAWQGWIGSVLGAVIGAAVSIGVAVIVLRKTLAHERRHFLEQLEAQRDLTIEDRRNAAWTEFIAGLRASDWIDVERFDGIAYRRQIQVAFHQWSLFVPPQSDHIAEAVDCVSSHILALVEEVAADARQDVEQGGTPIEGLRATSAAATALLSELVMHGKSWHRRDTGIEDAKAWFAQFSNHHRLFRRPQAGPTPRRHDAGP